MLWARSAYPAIARTPGCLLMRDPTVGSRVAQVPFRVTLCSSARPVPVAEVAIDVRCSEAVTVIDAPQELAWREGEADTVALMGAINVAVARLVATIRMLIDTDGWGGHGIRSGDHWVTWKAGVSARRAQDLVRIARRVPTEPRPLRLDEPTPYTPPHGERLNPLWFTWT